MKTPYNILLRGPQSKVITYGSGAIQRLSSTTGFKHSLLEVTGVQRPKPSSEFIPPTAYFLRKIDEVMPRGTHSRTNIRPGAPAWQWRTDVASGCLQSLAGNPLSSSALLQVIGFNPESSHPPELSDLAILKARNGLKGEFNAALFVAEWSQTNSYVRDKVFELTKFVKNFANRGLSGRKMPARQLGARRKSRPNVTGTLASRWLEFRYAVMPLIYDVYGVVESFASLPLPYFIVTSKKKVTRNIAAEKWFPTLNGTGDNGTLVKVKGMTGAEARIDCLPSNMPLILMSHFGVTNPAVIAWEATRLSFVVDWFVPVGDFLSQFDALLGYQVKGFSLSKLNKLECSSKTSGSNVTTSGGVPSERFTSNYESTKRIVRLHRTVSSEVPFARPRFNPRVSGERVVDAISLLRQQFRRLNL